MPCEQLTIQEFESLTENLVGYPTIEECRQRCCVNAPMLPPPQDCLCVYDYKLVVRGKDLFWDGTFYSGYVDTIPVSPPLECGPNDDQKITEVQEYISLGLTCGNPPYTTIGFNMSYMLNPTQTVANVPPGVETGLFPIANPAIVNYTWDGSSFSLSFPCLPWFADQCQAISSHPTLKDKTCIEPGDMSLVYIGSY